MVDLESQSRNNWPTGEKDALSFFPSFFLSFITEIGFAFAFALKPSD